MARPKITIPPGCTKVSIGWEHPETEEAFVVAGYLSPGYAGRGPDMNGPGEPAEAPEFCPLAVVEDKPHGEERPELLPLVEADLESLTEKAEESAADRAAGEAEDHADACREERMLGGAL